ncbi:hypothetical protein BB561_003640 [Smittium simulii]|uniref:CCHC-type domain-containing protein n=1 Tax=Smittium simulii TaxID=133385 RepID=A0A2T9YK52_9FUNG|nr:hypothetical protein BB561_003640 [Smittium simulii]
MKFLFKKTIDSFEIPTFLEIKNFFLALTYRRYKQACSFCKQQGHWKSDCPELKKFKQNKLKDNKKNSKNTPKIGQNIVGLALNGEVHYKIAPQVKAIKYSNKPIKLQSLELNNKKKELISKENMDRFTEFNSIKQPEKINLELSEWGNDHENYTENNVSVAVINMDLVNELADNNGFNDAETQHEIHYSTELEIALSEAFKMLEKKYEAYIRKDIEELELILSKSVLTMLCLQKTYLLKKSNFLKLKGYICVESKKNLTKIGSGLLITVKNKSGWSISELWSDFNMDPKKH